MRITGVSTWLSPDSTRLYLTVRATAVIPAGASGTITLKYKNDKEQIVTAIRPLQGIATDAEDLTGFVDVNEIADSLLRDYQLDTTFGSITVKLEEVTLDENGDPVKEEDIEEEADPSTKMKVMRLWQNYSDRRDEFWITSAYIDLSKSVAIDATIPQQYGFPGIYEPIKISQQDFDALIAGGNLKEKNGQVYSVKPATGVNRIAFLFSNAVSTWAQYVAYSSVYQLVPNSYDKGLVRPIQSQDIVKVKETSKEYTLEDVDIESTHFSTEIASIVSEFRYETVLFDRRKLTTRDTAEASFDMNSYGTTNTDYQ